MDGMVCQGCVATVKRALLSVEGVASAAVYTRAVVVGGSANFDELARAVAASGSFESPHFQSRPAEHT